MLEVISVRWIKFVNVVLRDERVVRITFDDYPLYENIQSDTAKSLKSDLERYLRGERIDFNDYDVNLADLSCFVRMVLEEVRKIPYGEVVTYKELADKLKTSPRAVGQALKKNPIPIIIPCHRVIAKKDLGGFSAGIDIKRKLLRLERTRSNL